MEPYIEKQRNDVIKAILVGLGAKEKMFVMQYVKDFAPRRAAEAAGYKPEQGESILIRPKVTFAIEAIITHMAEAVGIDAEWVLHELADNHRIARQQGNLAASNTALKLIMQHMSVDAMATQRTEVGVIGLDETVERMRRGRARLAEMNITDVEILPVSTPAASAPVALPPKRMFL